MRSAATEGHEATQVGHVKIGPLSLYYERCGSGAPLLLLHPGFGTIASAYSELRPALAKNHEVIAFEQQAHGHTPDIDRPLSYEQMVSDTAEAMETLGVGRADLFGWSDGGVVALGLAARHPDLVRKVAIIGAGYNGDAETPEFREKIANLEPDNENLAPFRKAYEAAAPDPDGWETLIDKVKDMYASFKGWSDEEMRMIEAPLMVMLGDRDSLRLEQAIEMYRMVRQARLAVLPASDHGAPIARADWIAPMLVDFFEAD